MNGVNRGICAQAKIVAYKDGSKWVEGINNTDRPIEVKIARVIYRAINLQTNEAKITSVGPWKVVSLMSD